MPLLDFTTYDDIRAALGVSDDEIEDATLSLDVYEFELIAELESVADNLIDQYGTVKALDEGMRTPVQRRFFQATRQFATYAVAKHLTVSLPLFSPKDITDGKASFSRYAANPYEKTIDAVKSKAESWRLRLKEALAGVQSVTATSLPLLNTFVVASPATDPVTG